jgi:acyl-CoA reductase-like NAD-dependent aldehyde dehydrogenase
MAGLKQDYWQNYVDSNWVDGGAGRLSVENPRSGEPLAEIALADAADIDRAVKAALTCHPCGPSIAAEWCAVWVTTCWQTVKKSQRC